MTYTPTLQRGFPAPAAKPAKARKLREVLGEKLRSARLTRLLPSRRNEAMEKTLEDRVEWVTGYASGLEKALKERLDIRNVHDLITHFPREYYRRVPLTALRNDELLETQGTIVDVTSKTTGMRRMKVVEVTIEEAGAALKLVFFNQRWLQKQLQRGRILRVMGKVEYSFGNFSMRPQNYELLPDGAEPIPARGEDFLRPVYPLSEGLSNSKLARLVQNALEAYASLFPAVIPPSLMQELNLMPTREALQQIHRPSSADFAQAARTSLKFREFFLLEAGLAKRQREMAGADQDLILKVDAGTAQRCQSLFPFDFTQAQRRVIAEIMQDLTTPGRMNRLIQGDVGCGKTAVALYAMAAAKANGIQSAMLAPTEILAQQHFRNLHASTKDHGISVELLTGSTSKPERTRILRGLKDGSIDIIVGTHAILEKPVTFRRLGLVVIDEQHKFGVKQRAQLMSKGNRPHRMVMSATPIPRSLSLTVFGDLSLSVIDELPPGRTPVLTSWVPDSARRKSLEQIAQLIGQDNQAYFIAPLVKPNPDLELKSAEELFNELKSVFGAERVGIVHGQMPSQEKDEAMRRFSSGEIAVLVATVVVEVGVDVPTANIMVIDHAERFGLSQLHQLRGRIGRGGKEARLYLFGNPTSEDGVQRLSVLCKTSDGFKIAEEDLRLRGFGDFIGTRQTGMPRLKLGDPASDMKILVLARDLAFSRLDEVDQAQLETGIQLCFGSQLQVAASA